MYAVYQDLATVNNYNYLEPWVNWKMIKFFSCPLSASQYCQQLNFQLILLFDTAINDQLLQTSSSTTQQSEFQSFLLECFQYLSHCGNHHHSTSEEQQGKIQWIRKRILQYWNLTQLDASLLDPLFSTTNSSSSTAITTNVIDSSSTITTTNKMETGIMVESFEEFRSRWIDHLIHLKREEYEPLRQNEGFVVLKLQFEKPGLHQNDNVSLNSVVCSDTNLGSLHVSNNSLSSNNNYVCSNRNLNSNYSHSPHHYHGESLKRSRSVFHSSIMEDEEMEQQDEICANSSSSDSDGDDTMSLGGDPCSTMRYALSVHHHHRRDMEPLAKRPRYGYSIHVK